MYARVLALTRSVGQRRRTSRLRVEGAISCIAFCHSVAYYVVPVGIPTCRDHSVTLHLYRRALAGAIARGVSLHKRSRLHFVRGSRGEAARVAEDAKNHYESGGCSNGDGFSARHSSREYGY